MTTPQIPQLEKLLAISKSANQSEWKIEVDGDVSLSVYVDLPGEEAGENAISNLFEADWGTNEDAAHLVAFQPKIATALTESLIEAMTALDDIDAGLTAGLPTKRWAKGVARDTLNKISARLALK